MNYVLKTLVLVVVIVGIGSITHDVSADHGDGEVQTYAKTVHAHTESSAPVAIPTAAVGGHAQKIEILKKLIELLSQKKAALDHSDSHDAEDAHDHSEVVELDASVSLTATQGMMGNYDLHLEVDGFTFAPEHADKAHVAGEGHAHVTIDGNKAGRMYGPWLYVPMLTKGTHTIEVSLATNDHKAYVHNGKPIHDQVTVTVR